MKMDSGIYLLEYIRKKKHYESVVSWLDEALFDEKDSLDTYRTIISAHKYDVCKAIDYNQIVAMCKEKIKDPDRWSGVTKVCQQMAKIRGKFAVVQKMALDFLRDRHVLEVIENALNEAGQGKPIDPSRIKVSMAKLETIGNSDGIQTDMFLNPEERLSDIISTGKPVPTPLAPLTAVLDGGPCAGELVTLIALPDGGKTLFLLDVAVTAAESGAPTFVGLFERGRVGISRLDCRITGHSAKYLYEHPQSFKKCFLAAREKCAPMRVMDYSRREVSMTDIRRDVANFVEDAGTIGCIVLDYGDLIRSSRHYEAVRFELDLVWKEMSRLAQEFSCPVWTATQSNRGGAKLSTIDMQQVAEAWGKMATTDMVLTINRNEREKTMDLARIFVAKTKKTGGSVVVPIHMNRLLCKMTVASEKDYDRKKRKGKVEGCEASKESQTKEGNSQTQSGKTLHVEAGDQNQKRRSEDVRHPRRRQRRPRSS